MMDELIELLNKIYMEQKRANDLKEKEIAELVIANCLREFKMGRTYWAQIEPELESRKLIRKKKYE